MPFRGLLRRKSKTKLTPTDEAEHTSEKIDLNQAQEEDDGSDLVPPVPIVKIMRQTTHSQELLSVPSFSPVATMNPQLSGVRQNVPPDSNPEPEPGAVPKRTNTTKSIKSKRLSNLLHLHRRSRGDSATGTSPMPVADLMPFKDRPAPVDGKTDEERQAQWEKRATLLVQGTTKPVSLPSSPGPPSNGQERTSYEFARSTQPQADSNDDWPLRTPSIGPTDGASDPKKKSMEEASDDDIQRAIQLHESGDLETSTQMFGRLADPNGANNALAQVLYGLALRHGWGIPSNPSLAIQYLTASARNASHLSELTSSLSSPTTKSSPVASGPLNRGELTLAIYELGNCHRNGWGVAKSPALAMQYFETAAELGDVDAMVDVAAAWEKGVKGWHGGKKDRGMAARWYRRAERAGRKEVGLSWIWKEKYDEPAAK